MQPKKESLSFHVCNFLVGCVHSKHVFFAEDAPGNVLPKCARDAFDYLLIGAVSNLQKRYSSCGFSILQRLVCIDVWEHSIYERGWPNNGILQISDIHVRVFNASMIRGNCRPFHFGGATAGLTQWHMCKGQKSRCRDQYVSRHRNWNFKFIAWSDRETWGAIPR